MFKLQLLYVMQFVVIGCAWQKMDLASKYRPIIFNSAQNPFTICMLFQQIDNFLKLGLNIPFFVYIWADSNYGCDCCSLILLLGQSQQRRRDVRRKRR